MQLVNLLLFSQHCFLIHFTSQYPQLTMPFHSATILTLAYLLPLSLAHSSSTTTKKHHLNLLSSTTKALLTHTLASFWRKQPCICNIAQCVFPCHPWKQIENWKKQKFLSKVVRHQDISCSGHFNMKTIFAGAEIPVRFDKVVKTEETV